MSVEGVNKGKWFFETKLVYFFIVYSVFEQRSTGGRNKGRKGRFLGCSSGVAVKRMGKSTDQPNHQILKLEKEKDSPVNCCFCFIICPLETLLSSLIRLFFSVDPRFGFGSL